MAPVVCSFSTNGLEMIYCQECVDSVVVAHHNVYELNETDPADLALLDDTELRLQKLVDAGEWKIKETNK